MFEVGDKIMPEPEWVKHSSFKQFEGEVMTVTRVTKSNMSFYYEVKENNISWYMDHVVEYIEKNFFSEDDFKIG
jgi:hypothetical protein